MPPGFRWLIATQFVSGLADHALLIVTMGLLHEQGHALWWAPLLKFAFTWAYVLLAPVVGVWADAVPKGALMGAMNVVKFVGAASLLMGLHPVLAFAVVGLGAAAYAPAKYGLLTEIVAPSRLVAANGWLEVSVVMSVLLGTAFGGLLASGACAQMAPSGLLETKFFGALWTILSLYAVAGLLNLGVPRQDARALERSDKTSGTMSLRAFLLANQRLWRDPLGGLSLAVTTLFWGTAAVLQFAVIRWADEALSLPLAQAAYLQATVALGVVAGAAAAAHRVDLRHVPSLLPWGVALGLMVVPVAWIEHWGWALPALLAVGALGGALVVPMNALLQYRGRQLLSSGRSIAVQGFNENLSVLLMLGLYAGLMGLGVPVVELMVGLGLGLAMAMAWLTWVTRRSLSEHAL